MVKYTYDAWGNNVVSNANNVIITDENHIGNLNPFRYRGYYYDADTKLYYLKSRYYDPEAGRFISQDGIEYLNPETINGLNLYAYCGNNPVMRVDENGNAWWHWLGVGIVAAVAVVAVVAGTILSAGTAAPLLGAVLVGAGSGFLMAAGSNVISQGVENNWNFEQMNAWNTLKAGGIGAAVGAVSGFASSYVGGVLGTTGHLFGNALSNTTIAGLNVGKAFTYLGGSQMISTVFSLVGKIAGGILGGALANELANQWFSINPTNEGNLEEALKGVVGDYILLGIYKVFKWVRQ